MKILIIYVARIGDTLFVSPALKALQAHYPNCSITFIGHPKRAEVMCHLPGVQVKSMRKKSAPFKKLFVRKKYDLAFVYGHDPIFVRYALKASQKVVAFEQKDPKLNALLYKAVKNPPFQSEHSIPLHLKLIEAIGISSHDPRIRLTLSEKEKAWAQNKIVPKKRLVGLQVASFPTKSFRDWPIAHFEALCQKMLQEMPDVHFFILGGKFEKKRTEWLYSKLQGHSTLFAGKTTLRQTAALMSQLHLYIGIDTGPTHIMGAFQAPMVVLYHGHSPSRLVGPLNRPHFFPIDHPKAQSSMEEISVETVFAKVKEALL